MDGPVERHHKSLTELALEKRKLAHQERLYKPGSGLAQVYENQADKLLTLQHAPVVGPGGEVSHEQTAGLGAKRLMVRETLQQDASRIAEDASIRRADLLLLPSFNAVATGIDAAESISAQNSLEKMLAHQLAVAHEAAMRLMDRALCYDSGGRRMQEGDSVEACRLANAAARLLSVYQSGLLTLQKLRTGGSQTVTVQHVNVQPGGQAVIGSVGGGGGERRGSD